MAKSQQELIQEEQEILDDLIQDMDNTLLKLDKKLTAKKLQAIKARESCLPDAYGMLVSAEHDKMLASKRMKKLYAGKKELYETRLILDVTDNDGTEREEIKIGLHTYLSGDNIFIMSWKMPLCRHYILDNSAKEYNGIVIGKYGEKYETNYKLQLKRKVSMSFDQIQNVIHLFPSQDVEEVEQIISDEFLQQLLKRRSEKEFKNIVFSIQKKQGEIIQTRFKQNMIVQGCAGSGKSMIMLHRLPIIIYDNPNSLDRNNLYIITPSTAYIQMANRMRMDLEIEDLKMGTIEQYYNYVLGKYNVTSEMYGTIDHQIKLSEKNMQYVYSDECVEDIKSQIEEMIEEGAVDYQTAYLMLNLEEKSNRKKVLSPSEKILGLIVKIQTVINENDNSLKKYHQSIWDLLEQLREFMRQLETRKKAVLNGIARMKNKSIELLNKKEEEINRIENLDQHSVKYQNYLMFIKASKSKITELEQMREKVENDDHYFKMLKEKAKSIKHFLELFADVKRNRSDMSLNEQYHALANRDLLSIKCRQVIRESLLLEDPYGEFSDKIENGIDKLEAMCEKFEENKYLYLPQDYLQKLMDAIAYYTNLGDSVVHNTYLSMMKKLGQESDKDERLVALECSPYLYLQILYQFRGRPSGVAESLITIDEAQNVAPEELRLIKALNGKRLVFNLFGDVKQHIEGTKGFDDWEAISSIAKFKKEYMKENYRNAKQVTEYCNKRFDLDMRAINLEGKGVHEIKNLKEFDKTFVEVLGKYQKADLKCIVVKNKAEADKLLKKAGDFADRIHNVVDGVDELRKRKWNLMTVEQSRGLEFKIVVAVTGRMGENEKYIAYTRALDELYVYDSALRC